MKTAFCKWFPVGMGLLFIYAGCYKLLHPSEATYALMSLEVHKRQAFYIVTVLAALELYLGSILLIRAQLKYSLTLTASLLVLFTTYLWFLTTLAHPPSCGCLGLAGMFTSTRSAAIFGIFRNCLLLWGVRYSYEYYVTQDSAATSAIGLALA